MKSAAEIAALTGPEAKAPVPVVISRQQRRYADRQAAKKAIPASPKLQFVRGQYPSQDAQ